MKMGTKSNDTGNPKRQEKLEIKEWHYLLGEGWKLPEGLA